MTVLCFDFDATIFRAAAAAQKRTITCKHEPTGLTQEFKTRTEFYGHWKKKQGGWLASHPELKLEDFLIEDIITPDPVEFALKAVKSTITNLCDKFEAEDYYGYVGGEDNFRKEICTLMQYKGQRIAELPVHLQACKEYVIKHHNARVANGVEADDMCSRDNYKALKERKDFMVVCLDKDFKGCEGNWHFYLNNDTRKVRGFGKLWRDTDEIDGYGRMFKYFQVAQGDSSDFYQPHCFSDKENGPVTAYNALKDCKNDTEAFIALKEHFKYMSPEPKTITNWKGDTFEIDWLYVLQEMFSMAHMERWEGDRVDVRNTFKNLGIEI